MNNDYTFQLAGQLYQIERDSICAGLRGALIRIERRLDGSLAVRFRERYLRVKACAVRPKVASSPDPTPRRPSKAQPSAATRASMRQFLQSPSLPVWAAAKIDKARTADRLED